jgi:hypothetical protein
VEIRMESAWREAGDQRRGHVVRDERLRGRAAPLELACACNQEPGVLYEVDGALLDRHDSSDRGCRTLRCLEGTRSSIALRRRQVTATPRYSQQTRDPGEGNTRASAKLLIVSELRSRGERGSESSCEKTLQGGKKLYTRDVPRSHSVQR